jgi:hypothetical protein
MVEGTMIGALVLGVIASFLAGILLPSIINFFRYTFGRVLVIRKETDITGVYDCEYHIHWKPEGQNIIYERIYIFRIGNKFYGYVINNSEDQRFRCLPKPGLRVKGELFIQRYFIGWWSHPLPDDNTYGAFNLRIDIGGKCHEGQWNGESDTYNRILEGRWVWKKNRTVKYGMLKLLTQRIFGASK